MTQIDTLKTYIDIVELAKVDNYQLVEAIYTQLVDDLEYQIINTYLNEVA
jgi:hypothetical protein